MSAALLGTLSGVLFAYSDDLPEVSALDNYSPNTITRVVGKNGQLVGEFAVERRVVIHYNDIPVNLRQAILSAEDGDFFQHTGFSIPRMVLALMRDVATHGRSPGGSTITQQLTRNMFASNVGFSIGDRSWERKIKETLVAMRIEKRYTKEEIFTFYANQIYFGHGAYGVEAAVATTRSIAGRPKATSPTQSPKPPRPSRSSLPAIPTGNRALRRISSKRSASISKPSTAPRPSTRAG